MAILLTIERELKQTHPSFIPIALGNIITLEGTSGILSYLSNIKMEDISTDLILLLDALRSALKFSDNLEDPILLSIFDNFMEKGYAE